MSSYPSIHKFCTSDGVLISDEQISFDEYLALDNQEDAPAVEDKQVWSVATGLHAQD